MRDVERTNLLMINTDSGPGSSGGGAGGVGGGGDGFDQIESGPSPVPSYATATSSSRPKAQTVIEKQVNIVELKQLLVSIMHF